MSADTMGGLFDGWISPFTSTTAGTTRGGAGYVGSAPDSPNQPAPSAWNDASYSRLLRPEISDPAGGSMTTRTAFATRMMKLAVEWIPETTSPRVDREGPTSSRRKD